MMRTLKSCDLSWDRAAAALFQGGLTGVCLQMTLAFVTILAGGLSGSNNDEAINLMFAIFAAMMALVYSSLAYGVGLAVLAGPAWWLLHRLGLRSWTAAVSLGLLLNGSVVWAFFGTIPAYASSADILKVWLLLSLPGVVVSLVIWRAAYR